MKNRSISMRGRGLKRGRQIDPVPISEEMVNAVIAGTATQEDQGSVYLAALTDPYLQKKLAQVYPKVPGAMVTSVHATGKDREVTQMASYPPEEETLRGACRDYATGIAGGGLLPGRESPATFLTLPATPLAEGVHKDGLTPHSVTFACHEWGDISRGNGLQPDADFNYAFTNEELGLTAPVRKLPHEPIISFSSPCSMIMEED